MCVTTKSFLPNCLQRLPSGESATHTPLSLRTSLKYLSYGWVLPEASELIVWRGGALGIGPPPTGFISIIFLSSVQPEKGLGLCLLEDLPQIDWKYPPASLEVFDC